MFEQTEHLFWLFTFSMVGIGCNKLLQNNWRRNLSPTGLTIVWGSDHSLKSLQLPPCDVLTKACAHKIKPSGQLNDIPAEVNKTSVTTTVTITCITKHHMMSLLPWVVVTIVVIWHLYSFHRISCTLEKVTNVNHHSGYQLIWMSETILHFILFVKTKFSCTVSVCYADCFELLWRCDR